MTFARTALAVVAISLLATSLAQPADAKVVKRTPTPTITQQPPARTNVRSATFAFKDAAAGSVFACSLDTGAFTSCTSPKTYAGPLAAGSHTFHVRATAPGAHPSSAAAATWTIDLTAPPVPHLSGIPTPSPTAQSGATLAFTDAEVGVTFLCSLDGAAATTCTSPHAVTNLATGTHTFAVRARDAAGNVSAAATGSWVVDVTPPPVPTLVTGPANPTNQTSATFAVNDVDATATLSCSLDGGAYVSCGPTATYSSLAAGSHTFDVRATDEVGNHSDAPRFTWTVDLTAPTPPAIVSGPAADTNNPVATFTVTLPAGASQLECALDPTNASPSFVDCSSPYVTAALADGPHTLLVRARDAATNESGATPYHWTVDTVAPPTPVVHGPAAFTRSTTATFAISDADATATLRCALDGGAATACADGQAYSSLADGRHTLSVTATDPAGNTSTTLFAWTVDTVAPTASLVPSSALTGTSTATFSEPVKRVSAASLALRVAGSTFGLATRIGCRSAAGSAVSCATGPVTTATVRPASPLVPGQSYVLAATAAVTDLAGNPLVATSKTFRARLSVEDTSVATVYAWRSVTAVQAYGGSYRTERSTGALVSYRFTGSGITWYTVTGPDQGLAYVYVDGVRKATVNDYAASRAYRVARTVTGLSNTAHTLQIVVVGRKGSTRGTGTFVSVDATKVAGRSVVATPALTSRWRVAAVTSASGGTIAQSDQKGASASLTFRGTSITWYTSTGRDHGIALVYVDGVLRGSYDLYASSTSYGVRRVITGLTNALHTVRVVVAGTHRRGATGTVVVLDRWLVG